MIHLYGESQLHTNIYTMEYPNKLHNERRQGLPVKQIIMNNGKNMNIKKLEPLIKPVDKDGKSHTNFDGDYSFIPCKNKNKELEGYRGKGEKRELIKIYVSDSSRVKQDTFKGVRVRVCKYPNKDESENIYAHVDVLGPDGVAAMNYLECNFHLLNDDGSIVTHDKLNKKSREYTHQYRKEVYKQYRYIAQEQSTINKYANHQICSPKRDGRIDKLNATKTVALEYGAAMLLQNDKGEFTFYLTMGTAHFEIKLDDYIGPDEVWLTGNSTDATVSNDQVNSPDDILDLKELEHKKKVLELETEIVNLRIQLMENKS